MILPKGYGVESMAVVGVNSQAVALHHAGVEQIFSSGHYPHFIFAAAVRNAHQTARSKLVGRKRESHMSHRASQVQLHTRVEEKSVGRVVGICHNHHVQT